MPYLNIAATEDQPPLCLHFRRFPTARGAPTLVLLHELGGALETWVPFAERLGERYDIYAFDQRCAGRSEHCSTPFTIWDLAEDTIRFADAAGIRTRFSLMGLAMGAVTAAHVASRHGDRLEALVLCDGTPSIDQNSREYLLNRATRVRKDGMRVVAEASFRNAFKGLDPTSSGSWGPYLERFTCNPPISYALHSEALAAFQMTDADYARVRTQTLALTGEHDFIWPPATGQALAAKIEGAEFEVIENAAHFPPLQRTAVVAERVDAFLRRVRS